jgi:hypothetical protein
MFDVLRVFDVINESTFETSSLKMLPMLFRYFRVLTTGKDSVLDDEFFTVTMMMVTSAKMAQRPYLALFEHVTLILMVIQLLSTTTMSKAT